LAADLQQRQLSPAVTVPTASLTVGSNASTVLTAAATVISNASTVPKAVATNSEQHEQALSQLLLQM